MDTEHKKVKLPQSSKINKAKRICELYSRGEHTIAACCNVVGVKYDTFKQWAQPNLSEEDIKLGNYRRGFVPVVHSLYIRAIESNTANFNALLKDVTREGLLKRASGIKYVETTKQVRVDDLGNSRVAVITQIEKYLPPDVTTLIFLANCFDLFNCNDERNGQFIDELKKELSHLTDEQLLARKLELEKMLAADQICF